MDDALTDPVCYECGGELTIVEHHASYLVVVCADCGFSHSLELAPGPDGKPVYWPNFRIIPKGDVSL